jgi:hypothetical protein
MVDIIAYYPNGEMPRLIDVPIESVLSGQPIGLAGTAGGALLQDRGLPG